MNLQRLRRAIALGPLEQRLFWIVVAGLLPLVLLSFAILLYNAQAAPTDPGRREHHALGHGRGRC